MHLPGKPKTPAPPSGLKESLLDVKQHPAVAHTGITTTESGDWAMLVRVRSGQFIPEQDLAALAGGFPLILEEDNDEQVARPAFPALGE